MISAETARSLSKKAISDSMTHIQSQIMVACEKGALSINHNEKLTGAQTKALEALGYFVTPTLISWSKS